MGSSINIALPSIGKEFGVDAVTLSWITNIYLLCSAIFCIPFGRMADMFGRRRIYIIGIVIFTLSTILLSIPPSIALLIAFRGLIVKKCW
jgi:MFS family permease